MSRVPPEVEESLYAAIYDTCAEAIAVARVLSEPGDEIQVHQAECEIDDDGDGCTCEPLTMTVGEELRA